MCPSISAISDRSFRGSVNYCMPMVLNIKEHEQFFKKCVQKMLTTALALCRPAGAAFSGSNGREIATFLEKIYSAVDRRTIFYIYLHVHADAE